MELSAQGVSNSRDMEPVQQMAGRFRYSLMALAIRIRGPLVHD